MKKSSKPTIFLLLTLLIIFTVLALVRVGSKQLYEKLVFQKAKSEKFLAKLNQISDKLGADKESLSAEEKIVTIAGTQLGLIRNIESPFIIKYDKARVEEINEVLKEKYE